MRCCWVEGWKEGERAARGGRRGDTSWITFDIGAFQLPDDRQTAGEEVVSKTVEGGTRKTEEEGRRASSLALVLALFARLPSRCSARRRKRIRVTDLPTSTRERERETHSTDICSELHPHQGARRLQTGGSEWPFSAASRAMPSVHSFSYKAPSHSRMMPRSLGRNIEREMETSPRWGFQKGHGLSCGERKRERMVGGWEGGLNERE